MREKKIDREDEEVEKTLIAIGAEFARSTNNEGALAETADSVTDTEKVVEKEENTSEKKTSALKIMDGKFGGEFLVRYLYDVETSMGWLQLIIVYPFDAVKKVLLKKNAACRAQWGCTGVETVGEGQDEFAPTRIYGKNSAPNGLLTEFETPNMPIPFNTIWKKIVDNYESIPVIPVCACASFRDVYDALIEVGEEKIGKNAKLCNEDYLLLTRQDIVKVAEEHGTNFVKVRAEFASRGWWDIDKNSSGYQKSVKIDGVKRNFYALKRHIKEADEKDEFKNAKAIAKTEYEEVSTLEAETKKINEIRRREQEAGRGKKKKGKQGVELLNMI